MNEKRSITELAATKFASLVSEWKFREPLIQEEKWMTRLSFLHDIGIAIEIEIDWRELEVFVLLVRLEHGSLPGDTMSAMVAYAESTWSMFFGSKDGLR